MFIFDTNQIPANTAELTEAITASLRKRITLPASAKPVLATGDLPNLASLAVDVSNGQIDPNQPLPDPTPPADLTPGPQAALFTIVGNPISLAGVSLLFNLSARKVSFAYGHDKAGKLIATLTDASAGHLQVNLTPQQLETGILAIAQKLAASSGVAITKVNVSLNSISPTELDVLLNITAKKFVTAVIRVSGRLSIDDQMIVRASNLNADADGMVGGIAVNFLRPHLQKLNGMPLPLLAFSLGNVKLHGVEVHTANGLQVTAAFGSETV
jgi:hypothetical protein